MSSRAARSAAPRAVLAAAIAALALAGCTGAPDPVVPTVAPSPGATAPPVPTIDLEGTAADNIDFFDLTNTTLIASGGTLDGRAFVDNLVAAGFPKSDLEVTSDTTAIGGAADNIQFAVRVNGTCVIGQYGNVGYASTTGELLETGRCLVGQTRPIDW